jgi:hypothetical protein
VGFQRRRQGAVGARVGVDGHAVRRYMVVMLGCGCRCWLRPAILTSRSPPSRQPPS